MSNNFLDSPNYYTSCLSSPEQLEVREFNEDSSSESSNNSIIIPDNYFLNCPNTTDGRQFGDYKSPTQRNEYIKYINNIWRDDNYRIFLQSNASQIMDREFYYNKKTNKCWANSCVHNKYPLRSLPQDYISQMDAYNNRYVKSDSSSPRTMPSGNGYRDASGKGCAEYKDYRLHPDSNKKF